MSFQNAVNLQQALAVQGEFATVNPWSSLQTLGEQYYSGGIFVGRFVWIGEDGFTLVNTGTGRPVAFVPRETQGSFDAFSTRGSLFVPFGLPVTGLVQGAFYALNTINASSAGDKAFARLSDGQFRSAASGSVIDGFVETNFTIVSNAAINELTIITSDAQFFGVTSQEFVLIDEEDDLIVDDAGNELTGFN